MLAYMQVASLPIMSIVSCYVHNLEVSGSSNMQEDTLCMSWYKDSCKLIFERSFLYSYLTVTTTTRISDNLFLKNNMTFSHAPAELQTRASQYHGENYGTVQNDCTYAVIVLSRCRLINDQWEFDQFENKKSSVYSNASRSILTAVSMKIV